MLPTDLPDDLPSFLERFGTDDQCRAYLLAARCSLLAGSIFEQTKTGLAKWFLAIYLVTSSKGGISAMELRRQMGFGSYQTAWTWLRKIRKGMVRPDRRAARRADRGRRDLCRRPPAGRPGRGAAGKTRVAGAIESGRGKARGRRLGRLRLAVVPDVSARSLEGFLATAVAKPATVATDGWSGYGGLDAAATATSRSILRPPGATRLRPAARPARSTCRPISTSSCSASIAAPRGASATASPASSSTRCRSNPRPTAPWSQRQPDPHG